MVFSFLRKRDPFEEILLQETKEALIISGVLGQEAQSMAQSIVAKAIAESKAEGLYGPEPLDASSALQRIKQHPRASVDYLNKVKGGMTDDDFLDWYAIPDVKRRILIEIGQAIQFAHFVDARSGGLDAESAMAEVRRYHPYYGDPSDESQVKGEDRPLPIEVWLRANMSLAI